MKEFKKQSTLFPDAVEYFNEDTAPDWLKYGGREGSTGDMRWFWNDHVMKLSLDESVETDYSVITRIK